MEKTIKYLENGEYHYATVRSVGDLAQLKTNSKETLVEAINELWNGGGNADPSKAPKPEGYDQLVQDVADAVKNQQEISQQWIEWQNEEAQLTEERKQAYLQAMKEMQEAIDKAKADAAALDDKTAKLDEQITKTFSDLDTSIQNMHEQLQKEADRMNKDLQDTKGTLSTLRTDLQNAQMDNGKIHDELTNINGKFEHKVWQTDLDPLKEQIDRAETSVQQTKDELLGKASRQDLDTVSNTVSKLDTQLKETAKGVEISVKKDELGGEIAEALTNKTNILLGTRRFTTNNWQQREHVEMCSDPWKGFLVAKQNSPIEGIQQAYDVKAGTTYTFSLFAKMDTLDDSNKPQIILAKTNLDTSLDTKIDVWRKEIEDITSDFKRYDLTFTPSEDCTIYPHVISNSNNPIFVCGYQLEIGKELTPWEPNQEDVGDYVEKSEAQLNVYNDKIQALTEKQRQQGDTQEQLRTEVTQTAEGVKQVSESLKNTNGDITKLRGDLERTADHMRSEYETYTNKAVGQISDSTLNLIRNSSFQNKDEDFAQWQNVSTKANVRQDENGLCWVELTQSGLTTDNPQGLTSNYFNVKQGKVTVAVDIKAGDKATLDNESVLFLELYNDAKKRVDFKFVTLSELGLNKTLLDDHKVHRGLYRLGIDRNDAKYMTVKAHLMRNGDLYFTNFSARLSSIDDGAYEPNPDDINQQILKQNTKIEQNAKEVAIKANSVDVTREIQGVKGELSDDIKSAKDAAIQVASGQINLRVNELSTQFDDKLNKRINEQKTASEKFTSDGIEQVVTKITNVKGDVDRLGDTVKSTGSRNLLHNTSDRYKTLTGNGYLTQSTASDIYTSTANYHGGDWFTYAATITNNSSKNVTLETWLFDQNKQGLDANSIAPIQLATHSADVYPGEKDKRVSTSFQVSGTTWFIRTYVIFDGGGAPNGSQVQVKDERLVEGRLSGDWSPNPEDINKKIDTQTLDSANIDDLRIQGHYFVRNLTGNPIGGWVYVDVTGNNNDRIRQDVYQDNGGKHMSRRLFGNSWSGWEQGAYISDVNNVKTEVTASVKNLGDRVITQVNSVETKVDNLSVGGRNYISPKNIKGYYAHEPQYNASTQEWSVVIDNGTGGSWGGGICFHDTGIVVPWGQAYTDSVEVYVTDSNLTWNVDTNNSSVAGASWSGNDNDNRSALTATPALNSVIPTNQWYRLSVTAWNTDPKNTNHVGINDSSGFGIINNTGHTVTVKFRRPKQELGSKVTDWSPNPDDTIEAIKEVNTKWDVANGQIQGKVTETQVNNILNGKGYATQSWAQTQFQMKSDAITLQAVRDNITNGIQNQVNSIQGKLEGDLSNICRNPTFDNHDGWTDSVHVESNWPEIPTKNCGVLFTRDGYYGKSFTVVPGDRYYTSVFANNQNDVDFVLGLYFKMKDGSGQWLSGSRIGARECRQSLGSITVPDNAVTAQIWASIQKFDNFGFTRFTNVIVKKNDTISQINLSPDQIKIASNKIVIDGNTDIHGDLNTRRVRLVGQHGLIDMTGDQGIKLANDNGSSILLGNGNMDLMYKNDFRMNIDSSMITLMHRNTNINQGSPIAIGNIGAMYKSGNNKRRGLSIRYNPGGDNEQLHGADFLDIGFNDPNKLGNIINQLEFTSKDMQLGQTRKRKGINFLDSINLQGYQIINIGDNDQESDGRWSNDPLMLYRSQWNTSAQPDRYQPSICLGYSRDNKGSAGVTFLWDQVKPFGNRDISNLGDIWFNGLKFRFGWVSNQRMFDGQNQPAFMRIDPNDGSVMSGVAFAPGSTWDVGSGAWNITGAMMNAKGA